MKAIDISFLAACILAVLCLYKGANPDAYIAAGLVITAIKFRND